MVKRGNIERAGRGYEGNLGKGRPRKSRGIKRWRKYRWGNAG